MYSADIAGARALRMMFEGVVTLQVDLFSGIA